MADGLTTKILRKARGSETEQHLVYCDDRAVGLLEKYRDTRTTKHPWKAFIGLGFGSRLLVACYPEQGGRAAALAALDRAWAKAEPCPACQQLWVPGIVSPRVPLDIRCACCQQP